MQEHNEWLRIAQDDFKASKRLIESSEPIIGPALFYTQQCAEKDLKAYLVYKKQKVNKTHNLILLVDLCCEFDAEFSKILPAAIELNPNSTGTRYPDSYLSFMDLSLAVFGIQQAEKILEFVKLKI